MESNKKASLRRLQFCNFKLDFYKLTIAINENLPVEEVLIGILAF